MAEQQFLAAIDKAQGQLDVAFARITAMERACSGIPTETLAALGEGGVKRLIELALKATESVDLEDETMCELADLLAALPKEQGDAQ